MTQIVRTIGKSIVAHVYKTPPDIGEFPTYYFCCESCGNCGRRWTAARPARREAVQHLRDHPLPEK